jgi:hypothetical protein
MILGMSTATFTLLHVIISLVGIFTGFVVMTAMCLGKRANGWTGLFLFTTVLTSVTGFMFHSAKIGPPHIVGAISLVVLAVCLLALYAYHLAGAWRWIYVVTAVLAQYLNVFVGVVQAFQKIPFLNQFAPKGNEPPFAIVQGLVLLIYIVTAYIGIKKFYPDRFRGPAGATRIPVSR